MESFRVITIRSSEDFTIYKQFDSTNSTFNQISSPYLHFSHAIYNLITHNPMSIAFISDYKAYTTVFLKCLRANPRCHFSGSKAYSYIYDLTWNDPDVKTLPESYLRLGKNIYLVNHSKQIYFNLDKYNKYVYKFYLANYPDPLALLTAVCYDNISPYGPCDISDKPKLEVGAWAFDVLSIENNKIKGYTEMDARFFIVDHY